MAKIKEVNSWLEVCNFKNMQEFFDKHSVLGTAFTKIEKMYILNIPNLGVAMIVDFSNGEQCCFTPYGIARAIGAKGYSNRKYLKNTAESFEQVYPFGYLECDSHSECWTQYLAYLNRNNVKNGVTYLTDLRTTCIKQVDKGSKKAIREIEKITAEQFDRVNRFIRGAAVQTQGGKLDV